MNPSTALLRFILAVGALIAVVSLGVLVLFFGKDLSQTQVVLLTMLATALVSETKSASAYVFDGTPDSPAAPAASTGAPASPTLKGTLP
jgi:hypothetical protein